MNDIFFHKKGKMILLALNTKDTQNVTEIASATSGTYAHTFNLLNEMELLGIIKSAKEGRTKYIKLTPKGKRLAKLVLDFENTLKDRGKITKPTRTKPAHENFVEKYMLEKYKDVLESIADEVKSKKPGRGDAGKYLRILGRYKSLVQRLWPRDKAGKKLKSDALLLVKKIDTMLKK